MTPEINNSQQEVISYRQPVATYRMADNVIIGRITDEIDAVKQAILHIIGTERYNNIIYDDNYGIELNQFLGKDIGFIQAHIETILKDALQQDDRIESIQVTKVEKSKIQENACVVNFIVNTIYGTLEEEISVLQ